MRLKNFRFLKKKKNAKNFREFRVRPSRKFLNLTVGQIGLKLIDHKLTDLRLLHQSFLHQNETRCLHITMIYLIYVYLLKFCRNYYKSLFFSLFVPSERAVSVKWSWFHENRTSGQLKGVSLELLSLTPSIFYEDSSIRILLSQLSPIKRDVQVHVRLSAT